MTESSEPAMQQEQEIDRRTERPSQRADTSYRYVFHNIGLTEEDMSDSDYEDYEDYHESEADSYGEEEFGTPAEAEQRRFNLQLRKTREKEFWKLKNVGNVSSLIFSTAKRVVHMLSDNRKLRKKVLRLMKGKANLKGAFDRETQPNPSTAEDSVPKNMTTADDSSEESDLDMKDFLPHPYPLRHRRLPRGRIRLYQGLTHRNLTPITLNGIFNVIPENLQRSFERADAWVSTVRPQ